MPKVIHREKNWPMLKSELSFPKLFNFSKKRTNKIVRCLNRSFAVTRTDHISNQQATLSKMLRSFLVSHLSITWPPSLKLKAKIFIWCPAYHCSVEGMGMLFKWMFVVEHCPAFTQSALFAASMPLSASCLCLASNFKACLSQYLTRPPCHTICLGGLYCLLQKNSANSWLQHDSSQSIQRGQNLTLTEHYEAKITFSSSNLNKLDVQKRMTYHTRIVMKCMLTRFCCLLCKCLAIQMSTNQCSSLQMAATYLLMLQ